MIEDLATVELKVDQAVIALYAELTDDYNPLHVDAEFAAQSPFGGVIAHGTLSLNLIWQAITQSLGVEATRGATLDIRFVRPVRIDDTITAGGSWTAERVYDVWARDQTGRNVIEGAVRLAADAKLADGE